MGRKSPWRARTSLAALGKKDSNLNSWRIFIMNSKAISWAIRIMAVIALVFVTGAQAQAPTPDHFSGILNDYTAATGVAGPWEMHGSWSVKLKRDGKADFSVVMTMEHPDYWVIANPPTPTNPPAPPATPTVDSPGLRNPHTHHLAMTDATVSYDPALLSQCPADSPATTPRLVLTGEADITGNGTAAPFQKSPTTGVITLSPLQVCITGGTEVTYSNMTMTFQAGAPAIKHFGSFPIHGVVRLPHRPDDHDRDHEHNGDRH
jgi:hypothetical protein